MKERILKYIISSILLCLCFLGFSQDTVKVNLKAQAALRIGADLTKFLQSGLDNEISRATFHADYHYKSNIYITADGGYNKSLMNRTNLDYSSSGMYLALGVDKNIMNSALAHDLDIALLGFRYGMAFYNHSADSIIIDNYWDTYHTQIEEQSMNTHWIEVVGGMKAELFFVKNLFIGWTLRYKIKLFGKKDTQMTPYYIPGFGKGEKNSQIGFNWSVYYRIPFKKKK